MILNPFSEQALSKRFDRFGIFAKLIGMVACSVGTPICACRCECKHRNIAKTYNPLWISFKFRKIYSVNNSNRTITPSGNK